MFERLKRILFPFEYARRDLEKYEKEIVAYYKQEIEDIFAGNYEPNTRPKPKLGV